MSSSEPASRSGTAPANLNDEKIQPSLSREGQQGIARDGLENVEKNVATEESLTKDVPSKRELSETSTAEVGEEGISLQATENITTSETVSEGTSSDAPPDPALECLRRRSARPNSTRWKAYVTPGALLGELSASLSCSVSLKSVFTSLRLRAGHHCLQRRSPNELILYEMHDSEVRWFTILATTLLPFLQELVVEAVSPATMRHLRFDLPRASLRRLTLLRYDGPQGIGRILGSLDGSLRELTLRGVRFGPRSVGDVARHCPGLQVLRLDFGAVSPLARVWQTVGPSLQRLGIPSLPGAEDPAEVAQSCRLLEFVEDCVPLAMALGDRLKTFMTVTSRECKVSEIAERCPNAVFHLANCAEVWDIFEELVDRLRSFAVDSPLIFFGSHRFPAETSRIERMAIYGSLKCLTKIFDCRHPYLRDVEIYEEIEDKPHHFSMLMDAIGRSSSSVETVTVKINIAWDLDVDCFRNFAFCSTRLKSVFLFRKVRRHTVEDPWLIKRCRKIISGIIADLAVCPALKEILIDEVLLTERTLPILEACAAFRGRNVDIVVSGTHYNLENGASCK